AELVRVAGGPVVYHAPVAAAGPSRVADGRAHRRVVKAPRAQGAGQPHVARRHRPHVRLHLRKVPPENAGQIREPAEVVDQIEAIALSPEAPRDEGDVTHVAGARPLAHLSEGLAGAEGGRARRGPEGDAVAAPMQPVREVGAAPPDAA